MIYRNWSLLSSTVVIWGGVATAGLAGIFLFGGKEKFNDYLCREGERLRQQDRAVMGRSLPHLAIINVSDNTLSGGIPIGLAACRSLEVLDLSVNTSRS